MRKPLIVNQTDVESALEDDRKEKLPRGLRKVVVPDLFPDKEVILLARLWVPLLNQKKPVVESNTMQLSYFDELAEQKPHWHENQVEVYTVLRGELAARLLDVDNDANFETTTGIGGSIVIPPRYCHLVRVKGECPLVQVLQFAVGRGQIKDDQQVCAPDQTRSPQCRNCPRHTECSLERHAQQPHPPD